MKTRCLIGFAVLLLAACARPDNGIVETRRATSLQTTASLELSAIDSLMWRQPDSALALLLPYFDTCCRDVSRNVSRIPNVLGDVSGNVSTTTEYENHYAHLLLSELLYKNDYEQTNRRDLQKAVTYFDSLVRQAPPLQRGLGGLNKPQSHNQTPNLAFLDARAHYINGVGYYENDSVVEACKEYLKALEVMEERFEEKELVGKKAQLVAMTYTHLTDLFSSLYLHEGAIYFGKKSIDYFSKYDANSWHIAWVLNEIGTHYDMMDDLDSAYCYYKSAFAFIEDTNTIIYRDVVTHLICLEYKKNHLQADNLLLRMFHLLSKSENDLERLSRCAIIGELFYHEEQYDSAWHYLNTVYRETPSVGMKKQAAEWLVEICKMQGKMPKMLEYAEFLVPFANQEENQSGLKTQLAELYDSFKQKTLELRYHNEIVKHTKRAFWVIGGMLAILLLLFFLYRKYKRGKQILQTQMEVERYAHKMQQAALAGKLKRSNAALKKRERFKTTKTIIHQTSVSQQQNKAENYFEEPICKRILEACNDKSNPIKTTVPISAYHDIALTNAQKAQLKDAAMRHYGQLFENLRQQYPELKEKDYYYCFLCLLGLDNAQISVMMQLSYRTIWEREKRLQTILHTDGKIVVALHEKIVY